MVLHNAHVVCYLRDKLGHYGFDDYTLEADHWAALCDIAPIDAAMLLCQFNPNNESFESAKQTTTDELKPVHLIQLKQRLADIGKADHKPRTLRDWHQKVRELGLKYHSWIDSYMEATTPLTAPAQTATPAPVGAASDAPAKRSNRKPSWATVAMPYMKSLFTAGNYKSASMFYKVLMRRAGESDSPFNLVNRELYCTEAGTTVSEGSLGNVWPQIRAH